MSSNITALEAIKAARAARERLLANGPVKVEFDRWPLPDGRPFTCYVFPQTCGEHDQILAAQMRGEREGRSGHYDGFVETVILCARNEDNSPIFQPAQRAELMSSTLDDDVRDLAVLIRKCEPTPEETRGNVRTPNSSSASKSD